MTRNHVRSGAVAVGATMLSLALVGCLLPGRDQAGAPDPGQAGGDRPGAAPSAAVTRSARPGATGESLEGRFTYQTMGQYVDAIVPMITSWIQATWPNLRLPKVIYVPKGARGPEDCLDSENRASVYSAQSYEYCGVDQSIYVGQDMLFTFYDRTGDAGPAVGLAHEFGHHIQQQLGVPGPRTATQSTNHENQADCLAGAWTQYTDQQGWLEYPDDIEDIDALFPLIGSAEGPDRDHGTSAERSRAFEAGFAGGAKACNAFYPGAPVL